MSYILHIDTSTDIATYLLTNNGIVTEVVESSQARDHASAINTSIEGLCQRNGIEIHQLAAITVCAGPGSYTGLRIGMATAKGYCYGAGIPLLAHNRLQLIALQHIHTLGTQYQSYITVRFAREGEYFIIATANTGEIVYPAAHIGFPDVINIELFNENACVITDRPMPELEQYAKNAYVVVNDTIDLNYWATYAFQEYKCKNTVNLSTASPFYLKQVYTHK